MTLFSRESLARRFVKTSNPIKAYFYPPGSLYLVERRDGIKRDGVVDHVMRNYAGYKNVELAVSYS